LEEFVEMIKVTYDEHMGSDLSVVNKARVSFGKKSKWEYGEDGTHYLSHKDAKLIKYLAEHKHFAPFGHSFASFHIKAPIFVARQLVKHKFMRWSEVSRRYVDDPPEVYVPEIWRGKSKDKKQGSDGVVDLTSINSCGEPYEGNFGEADLAYVVYEDQHHMVNVYNTLIEQGVAPEQARMVLPQSTMTEWYWSGSLDAFADMCRLRCKDDTQYETRLVADQISVIMEDLFPVSWKALVDAERG
jgi:thymidylate synthase (FAD)